MNQFAANTLPTPAQSPNQTPLSSPQRFSSRTPPTAPSGPIATPAEAASAEPVTWSLAELLRLPIPLYIPHPLVPSERSKVPRRVPLLNLAGVAYPETLPLPPAPDARPLDHFHLFPKLPLELRTMIVKIVVDEPHNVEIQHAGTAEYTQAKIVMHPFDIDEEAGEPLCKVVAETPAILHVNKEIRATALKSFRLIDSAGIETPFYFNPNAETLHLDSPGIISAMLATCSPMTWSTWGVRRLEIDLAYMKDMDFFKDVHHYVAQSEAEVLIVASINGGKPWSFAIDAVKAFVGSEIGREVFVKITMSDKSCLMASVKCMEDGQCCLTELKQSWEEPEL